MSEVEERMKRRQKGRSMPRDGDDTFHAYMARKIEKQRLQFGIATNNNEDGKVDKNNSDTKKIPNIFQGVVVLVNGHTSPDADTIMRILHRHGGDVEKYETRRVTHIIADRLSVAKANMYKRQKRPLPVCKPIWIEDCISAGKLLPCATYLVDELRDNVACGSKSVDSFFKQSSRADDDKCHYAGKGSEDSSYSDAQLASAYDQCCPTPSMPLKDSVKLTVGDHRTVGTDPNFLDSYFSSSRLSFIGSYKQRVKETVSSNENDPQPRLPSKNVRNNLATRFVFHIDMDSFFASVVLRKYPQYKNSPVAVGHGHNERNPSTNGGRSTSELSTCNYVARKYGVQKGMWLHQAKTLCPSLVVLPYDYDGYEEVSTQVSDIIHRYAEQYQRSSVEPVSCDESYVEIYADRYANVHAIAEAIRCDIEQETGGCTASIGVGKNKLLAKLSSEKAKPNASFVCDDWKLILNGLNLRDIPGVGYRSEQKLKENQLVTVNDVWDLGNTGETVLCNILGRGNGSKIFNFCVGEDSRTVSPMERKTIGAECNYGVRFNGPYGVDHMMKGLAKGVEKRMHNVGVRGRRLTLKLMERMEDAKEPAKFNGHGLCNSYSKACDLPCNKPTRDYSIFTSAGMKLFQQMDVNTADIRGLGIVISSLEKDGVQTNQSDKISSWLQQSKTTVKVNSFGDRSKPLTERSKRRVTFSDEIEIFVDNDVMVCGSSPSIIDKASSFCQENDRDSTIGAHHEAMIQALEIIDEEKKVESHSIETEGGILLTHPSQIDDDILAVLPPQMKSEILQALKKDNVSEIPQREHEGLSSHGFSSPPRRNSPTRTKRSRVPSPTKTVPLGRNKDRGRHKQLNVKHLMGLMSAKKSGDVLTDAAGEQVSLTQLDELPVALQLEVLGLKGAEPSVASSPPRSKRKLPSKSVGAISSDGFEQSFSLPERIFMATHNLDVAGDCDDRFDGDAIEERGIYNNNHLFENFTEACACMSSADRTNLFYRENIAPLHEWMDHTLNPTEIDMEKPMEFLSICVREKRLHDVVIILRSIKRRSDFWGAEYYVRLLQQLDDFVFAKNRRRLDLKWLGLI
mmetsp:Transcript_10878/g.16240  ORF Transcript_10878/g.16240 Transcript_10878/m.16240 type:complete len:1078 (-) Transcript_10878:6-3239(-)